ncbi:MAG: alcohol dehydrogenase catalytic domain-containing protein [Chloroflexi bacterium]|nr:alcohol dehydrogenase catalytic domain-containing protein [Chloroflexota bacterium]
MQAVVYHAPGDIRVEERPEPTPAADNLIVQVHACAICGTDLKLATIGNPRCHPPRIIGHEMVGHIVHVGADVCGFALGQRITLATTVACGNCPYCARGLGNMCPNAMPISYDFDGAFAQYVAIPPMALAGGNVIPVPDSVPDDAAALSEPLSCAINAQELAGLVAGDRVLIVGGGPLGALHAELAKALGAADVMIVQRSEPRLSLLRQLRDVRVIDGAAEDVAAVVRERTEGLGADVVIVCAPSREAQEQSLALARKGGAVSLFASLPKGASDVTLDSRLIHYGELRVVGASDSRPEHVSRVVALMAAGKIDWPRLITHRLPLAEIHAGLQLMKEKQSLKVLVYPGGR